MTPKTTPPSIDGTRRPVVSLLVYYGLISLLFGPFFPIVFLFFFFRYRSLNYRFDSEGVTMMWGALFRREVSLTYSRLQDIHLASNVFERWLGLARVQLQTAAGSAVAEITLVGLPDFEDIRDFLYAKMRGHAIAATGAEKSTPLSSASQEFATENDLAAVVMALRETSAEIRALLEELAQKDDPTSVGEAGKRHGKLDQVEPSGEDS